MLAQALICVWLLARWKRFIWSWDDACIPPRILPWVAFGVPSTRFYPQDILLLIRNMNEESVCPDEIGIKFRNQMRADAIATPLASVYVRQGSPLTHHQLCWYKLIQFGKRY